MKCEHCGAAMDWQALSGAYVCPDCAFVALGGDIDRSLMESISILELALRFYANEGNYTGQLPIIADGGHLAREALKRF